jgi:transcriptional regulator with XRE-family HTH domain
MQTSEKIKNLRLEKGLTQEELSKILGISRSTYANWEIDVIPSYSHLKKLARFFEKDENYFIDENANPKIVLYGSDGKLVDITDLSRDDQEYILALAEKFKKMKR